MGETTHSTFRPYGEIGRSGGVPDLASLLSESRKADCEETEMDQANTADFSSLSDGSPSMHAFVEEGAAFDALAGKATLKSDVELATPAMTRKPVIVIGGGQAGLSVGYHLKSLGVDFLILDASTHVGDAWRNRWDGLKLFSPAMYDGLDGMPFPAPKYEFPTKDQMADYLGAYAARFDLPVLNGLRVESRPVQSTLSSPPSARLTLTTKSFPSGTSSSRVMA